MGTPAAAAEGSLTGLTPDGDVLRVREVWEDNLEDEMQASFRSVLVDLHFTNSFTLCLCFTSLREYFYQSEIE